MATPPTREESQISDSDIEMLLETTSKYSTQLRRMIERLEIFSLVRNIALSFNATGFITVLSYFVWTRILGLSKIEKGEDAAIVMITGIICVTTFMVVLIHRIIVSSKFEISRLEAILNQLIRRSSQILDRGDVPFGQRILMEIILEDVEHLALRARR